MKKDRSQTSIFSELPQHTPTHANIFYYTLFFPKPFYGPFKNSRESKIRSPLFLNHDITMPSSKDSSNKVHIQVTLGKVAFFGLGAFLR